MDRQRVRFNSNRRTVLKRLGIATGAATVGLSGTVAATVESVDHATNNDESADDSPSPEYEHVVAISDLHWSSPATYVNGDETGATREDTGSVTYDSQLFLEEKFFRNQQPKPAAQLPDALLLVGDIIEMWWRGITASIIESSRPLDMIRQLHDAGTDVYLIAGNHDWWLMQNNDDDPIGPPLPWRFREEFFFESGDREFVAIHGHQGDPLNFNPVTNQAFCIGNDPLGYVAYEAWTSASGAAIQSDAAIAELEATADEFATEHYTVPTDPLVDGDLPLVADLEGDRAEESALEQTSLYGGVETTTTDISELIAATGLLSDNPAEDETDLPVDPTDPKQFVEDRVAEMYDEYTVFGHTHNPIQTDEYVNCGAWTSRGTDTVRDRTYVEIEHGEVSLWDWRPNESDKRIEPE